MLNVTHHRFFYLIKYLHFSKPITYALTLEELGTEIVHRYQGREPSGRMFNEIVLDHNSKNPFICCYCSLFITHKYVNHIKMFICVFNFRSTTQSDGKFRGHNVGKHSSATREA